MSIDDFCGACVSLHNLKLDCNLWISDAVYTVKMMIDVYGHFCAQGRLNGPSNIICRAIIFRIHKTTSITKLYIADS